MSTRTEFAAVHRKQTARGLLLTLAAVLGLAVAGTFVVRAVRPASAELVVVSSAGTDRGSRQLSLHLSSCNAEVRDVEVQESVDQVVVKVWIIGGGEEDCQDSTPIQLERPLGRRPLVDGSTGVRAYIEADRSDRYAWISRARLAEDDRTLDLETHLCAERVPDITVDEADDRVTLAVPLRGRTTRNRCTTSTTIVLDDPLADRQLVDLTHGYGIDLAGP